MSIEIKGIIIDDATEISSAFKAQGWNKPVEQYLYYYEEHQAGNRKVLVAKVDGVFAGYGTLQYESHYKPFQEKKIPEIVDLNVLEKFQQHGIGSQLIEGLEKEALKVSDTIGLCVGLLSGYGKAQRLYIKLGYRPDGLGISKDNHFYEYFEETVIDDDLVLGMTKELR